MKIATTVGYWSSGPPGDAAQLFATADELALDRLSADAVIELDEERKATMVGNLLVVLCSDHDLQPVVNAGSLY